MLVFFDTEFTSLEAGAALISIGLVDESGHHEFYAELSDTYDPAECTEFCVLQVLPHLEGGCVSRPLIQVRSELLAWLSALPGDIELLCDSKRDIVQMLRLLPEGLPTRVSANVLGAWPRWKRRLRNRGRRIHRQHGLRVHHALDDARANRLALQAWKLCPGG